MRQPVHVLVVLATAACVMSAAAPATAQPAARPGPRELLTVFLDCDRCFDEFIREEVDFVEYVRDPHDADVHVLVTTSGTGSGGTEYALSFIGGARFAGRDDSLTTNSISGDSEDQRRRALATALAIGLLGYLAAEGVPQQLDVSVGLGAAAQRTQPQDDPWNFWVFSVRGTASLDAEERTRDLELGAELGVDRVTHEWKISMGGELEHRAERFNLDEEDPLETTRQEREFRGVLVRSLGEHWSAGLIGEIGSSSFENTTLAVSGGPAVEFNVFPYSAYTRRQLRLLYAIGGYRARYREETLFGRTEETLGAQKLSFTLDQREPWGSLETRVEVSNYLPGFDRYRLEAESDVSLRLARGLSLSIEASASRIRDQLSLPRRGATPEEVLLRLRELSSRFEYRLSAGFTYTFGSIFNTIVNPRFGR